LCVAASASSTSARKSWSRPQPCGSVELGFMACGTNAPDASGMSHDLWIPARVTPDRGRWPSNEWLAGSNFTAHHPIQGLTARGAISRVVIGRGQGILGRPVLRASGLLLPECSLPVKGRAVVSRSMEGL
jgi:hypothetical protein